MKILTFGHAFVPINGYKSVQCLDFVGNMPVFLFALMQKETKKSRAVLKSNDFACKLRRREKNSSLLRRDSNSFSLDPPALAQNRDFNKARSCLKKLMRGNLVDGNHENIDFRPRLWAD